METAISKDSATASENKRIRVVGAAIIRDGRILCAQRGAGHSLAGKWEFPGGKIEPGETPQQALVREIHEELLCTVQVDDLVCTTEQHYDFGTVVLSTFLCHLTDGEPQLTEHQDAVWISPHEITRLDWAPADKAAVDKLHHMQFPQATA